MFRYKNFFIALLPYKINISKKWRITMKRNKSKNRIISLLMVLTIFIASAFEMEPAEVSAANKYIMVDDFIKYIVTEMKWVVDKSADQPYIDAAMKYSILKKGDFKDYNTYLTRTDCAVIANQLDEYLNLKYNYSLEVYELLSGCNYYDGKLYYSTEGYLYPKGETKETYPATQFLEEVLRPVLETNFKYDDWADKGLRAGYKYIYGSDDEIQERHIEIGITPENEYNVVGIDPFDDGSYIIQAWKTIKNGDRKAAAVLEKRISDINKISKSKREAVAAIVAKGIIKGSSNGIYVQNRSFKGSNKITAAGAKDVIQKVLNPKKRAPISPEGQLIRTTNLPQNYTEYPYILECLPNEFYEMRYRFMYYEGFKEGTVDKNLYAYPGETTYDFLYNSFYKDHLSPTMDRYEYFDKAISQAEQYLNCVFNMDYHIVDKAWIEKLASSYAPYGGDNIYDKIDNYIAAAKKNHVIVESKLIAVEPSSIYYDNGTIFIRSYVKYRITADDIDVDQDELLYGHYNDLQGLKNGEWRYGYYDIQLRASYYVDNTNYLYWGLHTFARISDWALRGKY
jgi:hypothetical protein